MKIERYNRENPPNRKEMEDLGTRLLESLSLFLNLQLMTFKEHYVQGGSIVLTFRATQPVHNILGIQIEGVLLFDVREAGSLPSVDAEILLFSFKERLGLQKQKGMSYLVVSYDIENDTWKPSVWLNDAEKEWGSISLTRENQYDQVVRTYDFWTEDETS